MTRFAVDTSFRRISYPVIYVRIESTDMLTISVLCAVCVARTSSVEGNYDSAETEERSESRKIQEHCLRL